MDENKYVHDDHEHLLKDEIMEEIHEEDELSV
jgi:hypothetical protein